MESLQQEFPHELIQSFHIPKEFVDLLVEYFASVFKEEHEGPSREECYGTVPGMSQVENIRVNDQQVYLLLNEFNIYKSQGPDEIHPSILKVLNPLFISAVIHSYLNANNSGGVH